MLLFLGIFVMSAIVTQAEHQPEQSEQHRGKILSIFSVVRFPNSGCSGTTKNGTCYSAAECSQRGGSSEGSCASGYGVCCTITLTCGKSSSENCSYFESSGQEVGACRVTICPCARDICQLRLDFSSFVINQPDTSAASVAKILANKSAYSRTQCLIDQFTVTSPGNQSPPLICGSNTGQHMFVDASAACNELAFVLGSSNSVVTRTWSIKVTQFSCAYNNLAPDGCTQYFYGPTTQVVKTYNFDGGMHLADQNQNICVRRERGMCKICWTVTTTGDFETSTSKTGNMGQAKLNSGCCGFGPSASGKTSTGYDCVRIPSASNTAGMFVSRAVNGICGGQLGLTSASTAAKTVCSMKTPFSIRFISDHYEWDKEKAVLQNGFRLSYILKSC